MSYNTIQPFIEGQFREYIRDEGPLFVNFLEAYYQWLETEGNPLDLSENILSYRSVDTTIDDFLDHFVSEYLFGIPAQITADKRFIIKHVLDVYRSKGTIQGYKLLFRLLYGEDIDVYLPQVDMLAPSDGDWYAPLYLELSDNPLNASLVSQRIKGSASGVEAIVENYVQTITKNKINHVFYLRDVTGGSFHVGEKIIDIADYDTVATLDAPTILGSVSGLELIDGGQQFNIGDVLVGTNGNGQEAVFRVSATANGTGTLRFSIVEPGTLYSTNATAIITRTSLQGRSGAVEIGGIGSVQALTICDDMIFGHETTTINALDYAFLSPNHNVNTVISDALTFNTSYYGDIQALTEIETGNNYTSPPNITIKDFLHSSNLAGNVFYSTTSNVVTGVNTTFTSLALSPFVRFQVTHNETLYSEHRIITSITNNTYMTLDDYPASYADGRIASIAIIASGIGYTNSSVVSFTGSGSGANASVIANSTGHIVQVIINNPGVGYITPPLVMVAGGTGANLVSFVDYANFSLAAPALDVNFTQVQLYDPLTGTHGGNNSLITAVPQFGTGIISEVAIKNSGFSYIDGELLNLAKLGALKEIDIQDGGLGYANNEYLVFAGGAPASEAIATVITDANGAIISINSIYLGSGYETVPAINIISKSGSGAVLTASLGGLDQTYLITGTVDKAGAGQRLGEWTSTKGFLNSDKYIQDSYFYQQYSYQIRASKTLESYADIMKKVVHLSGTEMFGAVYIRDTLTLEPTVVVSEIVTSGSSGAWMMLEDGTSLRLEDNVYHLVLED